MPKCQAVFLWIDDEVEVFLGYGLPCLRLAMTSEGGIKRGKWFEAMTRGGEVEGVGMPKVRSLWECGWKRWSGESG